MKFPKMKLKAYHLFIVLLLALMFCSCLGNPMREGYTSNTYSGPEGNEATVYTSASGRKAVAKDGSVYYNGNYDNTYNNANKATYTGRYGNQATVYTGPDGNKAVSVYSNNNASSTTYTGPRGNQATVYTGPEGNTAVNVNGNDYYGNNNASSTTYTGPRGNQATVYTGPGGNKAVSTNRGIYRNQIPYGQEDLYILKSEVVPPVCPACPQSAACPRQKPCQPCPPCARCPEPAFECKKVPNYNSSNDQFLPRPVMSDFSQFGS